MSSLTQTYTVLMTITAERTSPMHSTNHLAQSLAAVLENGCKTANANIPAVYAASVDAFQGDLTRAIVAYEPHMSRVKAFHRDLRSNP